MADLDRAVSIADLRLLARKRLPKPIFDFIDGGAEDELSLADNRAAFERVRLVPRVLVDVAAPKLETTILGGPAGAPFVIAPMGSVAVAWPGADVILARAAAARGVPYTMSTMSTTALEDMREQVDGRLWFQLYVLRDPEFTVKLVDRAAEAGYEAMAVTVDTYVTGKRERDLRNDIKLPIRPGVRLGWQALTHPRWALDMLRGGSPRFENIRGALGDHGAGFAAAARFGASLDAGMDFQALQRIRDRWPGKLMVKGVEHPADAARLVAMGIDGIWISNHGGRQLDGAIATADALPVVAAEVDGKVPIIIDSGVRRGVDALKARALGAQAVAVGRAALYGAAAGGAAGAARALDILLDELKRALQLTGVPAVDAVDRDILASQGWPGR